MAFQAKGVGMKQVKIIYDRIISDVRTYWRPFLAASVVIAILQLVFHNVCPFRIIFDIPCPGCGLTHGCIYVLTLRWHSAWQANPVSFLWVPAIAMWLSFRYIAGRRSRAADTAIVVTAVITLIRYALVFPDFISGVLA